MPALAAGLSIGEYARSLVRRLALLSALLLSASGRWTGSGYFWPAWAWLGLGELVLIDFGAAGRGAIRREPCGGWHAYGRSWAWRP